MDEFDRAVEHVCAYTEMHALSPMPELAELGYRSFRVLNYIALYKVLDGGIVIAHIFHERQDYARLATGDA